MRMKPVLIAAGIAGVALYALSRYDQNAEWPRPPQPGIPPALAQGTTQPAPTLTPSEAWMGCLTQIFLTKFRLIRVASNKQIY